MSKHVKALYALSADPVTYGHLNIITRAAETFDELIVAIGINPAKNYTFDIDERCRLASQSTAHLDNVTVTTFSGLLVDYAYHEDVSVIVKGVRNNADFEYETLLHQVGESQKQGIDTHLLVTEQQLSHVSSSNVKAIQYEHGMIHDYVPLPVKVALERVISEQTIIGVTGSIASGKSTFCEKIEDLELGHNIDMDKLVHELYVDDAPFAIKMRKEMRCAFGTEIIGTDADITYPIDRKALGEIVFGDREQLDALNSIVRRPVLLKLKKALHKKRGLILLNSALLVEGNLLDWCNNRVIMFDVDKEEQLERLTHNRGHSQEEAIKRVQSQMSCAKKKDLIQNVIDKSNFGQIWEYNTTAGRVDAGKIAYEILRELDKDE